MNGLLSNEDVMGSLLRALCDPGQITDREPGESLQAWQRRAVTEHAAPYIAAAERESIRQLATERDAVAWSHPLWHNECSRVPFADLIGGA